MCLLRGDHSKTSTEFNSIQFNSLLHTLSKTPHKIVKMKGDEAKWKWFMLLKNHFGKLKTWTWKIPLWSLSESQWKFIFPKLTMPLNWIQKNIYNRSNFVNRILATDTNTHIQFPLLLNHFIHYWESKMNTAFPYGKFF